MKKSNDIEPWARIEAATDSDAQDPELTPPTLPSPVDRQVANEKRSTDITDELTPPTASNPLELDHYVVNMKRFTNELALPNPSNPPEVDHDILYNEKRLTNELTPPTPFNPPEVDHDIVNKKIAANSIETMKKSDDIDGWAWLEAAADSDVNELTPPTPFIPPEVDHDIINEKIGANAMGMTKPGAHTSLEPRDEELGELQSIVETTQDGILVGHSEVPSPVRPSTNIRDDEDDAERGTPPATETTPGLPITASVQLSTASTERSAFGLEKNEDSTPFVPEAVLVQDGDDEVVIATIPEEEKRGFFERKGRLFALGMCLLLVLMAIIIPVLLTQIKGDPEVGLSPQTSSVPSMQPSSSPSFDPRPTLEIVQERGYVRCGLTARSIALQGGGHYETCRAISAVLFGDPDSIKPVPVTHATRFEHLHDRSVDVLLSGDTHTIEREVREISTGSGFTFSSPIYYDGMAYLGEEYLVRCAEETMRYNECSQLVICVNAGSTSFKFIQSLFPSDFFLVTPLCEGLTESLLSGACNVIAASAAQLQWIAYALGDEMRERELIISGKLMTNEPAALVTRKDDREFSDIINWVVQALFYGDEQGLAKDLSLCQNYTASPSQVSELNFLNAVYCVGSYSELNGEPNNFGMNLINNGGSGMLYAIPFGDLTPPVEKIDVAEDMDDEGPTLWGYRTSGSSLKCGVVVPSNFSENITASDKLVGMGEEYCRTVAAALFNGNSEAVKIITLPEDKNLSFAALNNGTVDVLAGALIERKYDFASSPSLQGFDFSMPYYYGNETGSHDVSVFSLATREDDATFTSFVNCIVLATIYAQEHRITSVDSNAMPLLPLFGRTLKWSLRDAISFSGSYDQIYTRHFGEVPKEDRGRNILNNKSSPQHHSFPGLL